MDMNRPTGAYKESAPGCVEPEALGDYNEETGFPKASLVMLSNERKQRIVELVDELRELLDFLR